MIIREAKPEDALAIAELKVICWRDAYEDLMPQDILDGLDALTEAPHWKSWLSDPQAELGAYVAEGSDGALLGYALAGPMRRSGENDKASRIGEDLEAESEVYAIYVHPSHQRQDIGRSLFAHLTQHLVRAGFASVGLWMLAGNARAERFYQIMQGREAGKRVEIRSGRIAFREKGWIWPDLRALRARLTIKEV